MRGTLCSCGRPTPRRGNFMIARRGRSCCRRLDPKLGPPGTSALSRRLEPLTNNHSPTLIETRELTKMYGDLYALDRLSLRLDKGYVYGFIGPNGAGKTTTMRILATLLNPSWG